MLLSTPNLASFLPLGKSTRLNLLGWSGTLACSHHSLAPLFIVRLILGGLSLFSFLLLPPVAGEVTSQYLGRGGQKQILGI